MRINLFKPLALKFLLIFGLYCLIWSAIILAAVQWLGAPDWVMLSIVLACFATFPLVMVYTRVTEHGEGEPIPIEELQALIEEINFLRLAIFVTKKDDKKYRIVWQEERETKRIGWLPIAGGKRSYALHIALNDRNKTARLVNVFKQFEWGTKSVVRFGTNRTAIPYYDRDPNMRIQDMDDEDIMFGNKFKTEAITNPVINTLLNSGWTIHFATF